MSRCFPFPPPGYDKKPIPEDANVLKEEKKKEKKHKKEKRDKEKREGKEKRDKERREGKHKEKRDKKDKHKDRKDKHREKKEKVKDGSKEKEKSTTSEASKVAGLAEGKSGEKLGTKEGKDKNNNLDEKNRAAKFHGQNGEPVQSNLIAGENEESEHVQELGRRINDQEKVTSSQPDRLSAAENRRDHERERCAVRNPGNSGKDKGKGKSREFDIRKVDGQGYREEDRFTGHSMVQNLAEAAKCKVSGMPAVGEKNDDRKMEGKEKTKEKREKREKRGDNNKDKDTDKKDQGKDKDRGKERKKEEKAKEKSEQKKSEVDKSKDVYRTSLTGVTDEEVFDVSSEHNNKANAEGNFKKRKDLDINGFLHDNEIRPCKLQRPASHLVMENGRKLEANQNPGVFASDTPGVAANLKGDSKEHRKNGVVESQSLPLSKQKPPSMTVDADQILEVSKKHPHPDSKYLNQVLSVPKMDQGSHVVDNYWLFDSKELPSRKAEVGSVGVREEPRVWSEAVYLESADIVALPYVLPY